MSNSYRQSVIRAHYQRESRMAIREEARAEPVTRLSEVYVPPRHAAIVMETAATATAGEQTPPCSGATEKPKPKVFYVMPENLQTEAAQQSPYTVRREEKAKLMAQFRDWLGSDTLRKIRRELQTIHKDHYVGTFDMICEDGSLRKNVDVYSARKPDLDYKRQKVKRKGELSQGKFFAREQARRDAEEARWDNLEDMLSQSVRDN
jgi:hypothetical protein